MKNSGRSLSPYLTVVTRFSSRRPNLFPVYIGEPFILKSHSTVTGAREYCSLLALILGAFCAFTCRLPASEPPIPPTTPWSDLQPGDYGFESVREKSRSLEALNRTSLVAVDRLVRNHIQFQGGTDNPYNQNAKGYAALLSRVLMNAQYLPRYGITDWRIRSKYGDKPVAITGPSENPVRKAITEVIPKPPLLPSELSLKDRRSIWREATRTYADTQFSETRGELAASALGPVITTRPKMIEVKRFSVKGAQGDYELVSFVWEPFLGLQIPGLMSIPRQASAAHPTPAVLNFPACGDAAGREDVNSSVQRRLGQLALAGIVGIYTEGFCGNGLISDSSDYGMNFSQYIGLLGGRAGENAFNVAFSGQFIRLAQSLEFVNGKQLGVTGYSFGLGVARTAFSHFREIQAFVMVGDHAFLADDKATAAQRQIPAESYIRTEIRFSYPVHHRFSFDAPDRQLRFGRLMNSLEQSAMDAAQNSFAPHFGQKAVQGALATDLDRNVLVIMAEQDGFNDVPGTLTTIATLQAIGDYVGATGRFDLERVPGNHNYNSSRAAIAAKWLAKSFGLPLAHVTAEDAVALPFYDETQLYPIESRDKLLNREKTTMHSFYGNLDLNRLHDEASRSARRPPPNQINDWLRRTLNLPDIQQATYRRTILVDACRFELDGTLVDFNYLIVPINNELSVGIALVSRTVDQSNGHIALHVSTNEMLPSAADLKAALKKYDRVAAIVLPGYGIAGEAQQAEGNLARELYDISPLEGICVAAVQSAIDSITSDCTKFDLELLADGIEASVTATLTTILDERIKHTQLQNAAASIEDIVKIRPLNYPPTFLYTPNIYGAYDLPDLRLLAGPGRVEVISTAQEQDFNVYGPRW